MFEVLIEGFQKHSRKDMLKPINLQEKTNPSVLSISSVKKSKQKILVLKKSKMNLTKLFPKVLLS